MSHTFDIYSPDFPHGTPDGYRLGCHGSVCGGVIACRDVYTRYQGDWGFKKQIDAGIPAADIIAAEQAESAAVAARDRAAAKAAHAQDLKTARGTLGARPQVKQLHAEGLNDGEIAERLGIGKNHVGKLRRELGLVANRPPKTERVAAPRKPRPSKLADVIRLNAEGKNDTAIAAELGMTANYVGQLRRAHGIARVIVERPVRVRPTPSWESRATTILQLHAEGLSNTQIVEQAGVTYSAVARALAAHGLTRNKPTWKNGPARYTQRRGDASRTAVAAAHADGLSDGQIAERTGLNKSTVKSIRVRLGLPAVISRRPVKPWRKDPVELQPHGTNACWARGCRRDECVEAHRAYHREYDRARRARGDAGPHHGTAYGYQLGCRGQSCPSRPSCTDAMLEQDRARRRAAGVPEKVLVDAAPMQAHVRDLMAAGMRLADIATAAGVPFSALTKAVYKRGSGRGPVSTVLAARARAILAVPMPAVTK